MKNQSTARRMARLLARRERHGWSWAELSRRTGEPLWKLRWWGRKLSVSAPAQRLRRTLLPVHIVGPTPPPCEPLHLILPGGLRILVPGDFDPDHLRRLIAATGPAC